MPPALAFSPLHRPPPILDFARLAPNLDGVSAPKSEENTPPAFAAIIALKELGHQMSDEALHSPTSRDNILCDNALILYLRRHYFHHTLAQSVATLFWLC